MCWGGFMFELIMKAVFVLFAVLGMAEALRLFLFWLLKSKNPGRLYLVLSMRGHDEEAELALRSASERVKWMSGGAELLLVDRGMDEETRKICDLASEEMPELRLCRPDEVEKIICP